MTTAISTLSSDVELTDALWVRYRTNGDAEARAQLLDRYVGLVYHVAHETPPKVFREEDLTVATDSSSRSTYVSCR